MDAREYLHILHEDAALIQLSHYDELGYCDGRGTGLIIDDAEHIAVMLEPCGNPLVTQIEVGAIVSFIRHPEAPPKIVGAPAYVARSVTAQFSRGLPMGMPQML
ncbi:MAG TPA: hypothetical protein VGM98_00065 [Schlesneria sp.]